MYLINSFQKEYCLFIVFALLALSSFGQKCRVEYSGKPNERIFISIPLENGEYFNGSFVFTQTSEEGKASLSIDINQPSFLLLNAGETKGLLYISPGEKLNVRGWRGELRFSGPLSRENKLLNEIYTGTAAHAIGKEPVNVKTLVSINSQDEFKDRIQNLIKNKAKLIGEAHSSISEAFIAQLNRLIKYQMYDQAMAALVLKFNSYMYYNKGADIDKKWKEVFNTFFTKELLNASDLSLPSYFDYLFNYIVRYKAFFLKECSYDYSNTTDLTKKYNAIYFIDCVPGLISNMLPEHIQSWFVANYISQFIMGSSEYHTPQLHMFYNLGKSKYDLEMYDMFLQKRLLNAIQN